MVEQLILLEHLSVHFSSRGQTVRAVHDVDLEIFQGETLGLVGESGCGKSTLGRAMVRLVEPTHGSISFLGRDITCFAGGELRRARAEIQMIFQDPFGSLNPRRRVAAIVAEPLRRVPGMTRARALESALDMLDRVGLGRAAGDLLPDEFSGGQRQRIGIARALVGRPKFIVADEPVSALDVSIQAQVVNLLTDLTRDLGLTMVFISHDLGVVRHVASRIAVMYLGQIVEVAGRDEFFAGPQHPYSEALLSAVPTLPARGDAADTADTRAREIIVLQGELPDPANRPAGCAFHGRCRYAVERCRTEMPMLREVVPGRTVRCHLPLAAAGSMEVTHDMPWAKTDTTTGSTSATGAGT